MLEKKRKGRIYKKKNKKGRKAWWESIGREGYIRKKKKWRKVLKKKRKGRIFKQKKQKGSRACWERKGREGKDVSGRKRKGRKSARKSKVKEGSRT